MLFEEGGAPRSGCEAPPSRSARYQQCDPGDEPEDEDENFIDSHEEVHNSVECVPVKGEPLAVEMEKFIAGKSESQKKASQNKEIQKGAPEKEPTQSTDIHCKPSFCFDPSDRNTAERLRRTVLLNTG